MIDDDKFITFIVPCYDDYENFERTLLSLVEQCLTTDEIVVVDSSEDQERVKDIIHANYLSRTILYHWIPPSGVYRAQNFGILQAKKEWIQIINSGDTLLPGARQVVFDAMVDAVSGLDLLVFAQTASLRGEVLTLFEPSDTGIWPHQSVLVRAEAYRRFGLYDESFRFTADQLLMLRFRKLMPFALSSVAITDYDLSGISSRFQWRQCRELYFFWRQTGSSVLYCLLLAYVKPMAANVVSLVIGRDFFTRWKYRKR